MITDTERLDWLLAAVVAKRPELKVVEKKEKTA